MSEEQTGGLHIDSDWKEEAAREKQRLIEEEKENKQNPDAEVPSGGTFVDLVNMLAMQAMIGIGGYKAPGGEQMPPNSALAKHYIDLLDMLDNKTKGNLTDEETKTLNTIIYELRMQFVQSAGSHPVGGAGEIPQGI